MSTPALENFVGFIPTYPRFSSPQQMNEFLESLFNEAVSAGIKVIRTGFFWQCSTPTQPCSPPGAPGSPPNYGYNAAEINLILQKAAQRGFAVYAIINPPNHAPAVGWNPPNIAPATRATFLRLAADMARIYGDKIEFWEILNEANHAMLDQNGAVDIPYYEGTSFASLLRDAYLALLGGYQSRSDYLNLKNARGGSAFKLYAAGTAGTDRIWLNDVCVGLEALYNAHPGEGKYINGFSIHPFSFSKGPDEHFEFNGPFPPHRLLSHGTLAANIEWAKLTLNLHPAVPNELFMGEYGWSTYAPDDPAQAVSEQLQATYVAQGFLEAHASNIITRAIWAWTFRDMDEQWHFWDHTGALRVDNTRKPSYLAIKTLIDKLRGMELQQNLSWMLPDGRMFLYRGGNNSRLVYWNPAEYGLTIGVSPGATVKHFETQGGFIQGWPPTPPPIRLHAISSPRYLEVNGGTITSINGISLDNFGAPYLPGLRPVVVRAISATASSTAAGSSPSFAFDGNPATMWNAGRFGEAWVEGKFYSAHTIKGVSLTTAQLPPGRTDHEILLRISEGNYRLAYKFTRHTASDMRLVVKFPTAYQNVTRIKVRTVSSPGWPAWFEITAYQ